MTDTNGSATALQSDAGTPAAANGAGGEGSPAGAADPFAGLDTGTREWIGTAGIKDVASLAAKARNAESLIGQSVRLPGKDAKPEDVDAFLSKVLSPYRPEKPEGYEFKLPDGLPEGLPYDKAFADRFKAAAHAAGIPTKAAAALHDFYVKETAAIFQTAAEATRTQVEAATKALETAFGGAKDSDAFKQSVGYAGKFIAEFGGEDLMKGLTDAGLLGDGGVVLNPAVAIAFAKAGKMLFKEDGLVNGSGSTAGENPFDGELDKLNQTAVHRAIKTDRARAIQQIKAAGKKPSDFGLVETA